MGPTWVRVTLPGVGTWTQADTVPLPEGAKVLTGQPATAADGTPLPDVPESAPAATAEAQPGKPASPVPASPAAAPKTVKEA